MHKLIDLVIGTNACSIKIIHYYSNIWHHIWSYASWLCVCVCMCVCVCVCVYVCVAMYTLDVVVTWCNSTLKLMYDCRNCEIALFYNHVCHMHPCLYMKNLLVILLAHDHGTVILQTSELPTFVQIL